MFGRRFLGGRYFGARYFGDGGVSVPGDYLGKRYAGPRYFGPRYFSTTGGGGGGGPSYTLNADAGTLTLTGEDAQRDLSMAADAGTLTLTGYDAALTRGYVLAADAGTLTLTGQDADLTYTPASVTYTLTADAGALTLTGQDATFGRTYVLDAESGALSLSGQDAVLNYSGNPEPEPETRRRRGHASQFVQARKKLALQHLLEYLTEEEPAETTKRVIAEVKAGRPIPQVQTPRIRTDLTASELADKLIPSRVFQLQNLMPDIEPQKVIQRAIRIAQERDDEDILMLL